MIAGETIKSRLSETGGGGGLVRLGGSNNLAGLEFSESCSGRVGLEVLKRGRVCGAVVISLRGKIDKWATLGWINKSLK